MTRRCQLNCTKKMREVSGQSNSQLPMVSTRMSVPPPRPTAHVQPKALHKLLIVPMACILTTFGFSQRGGVCPGQPTGGWHYVKVAVGANLVLGVFFFFFLSEAVDAVRGQRLGQHNPPALHP
jgi:hypothetical protein